MSKLKPILFSTPMVQAILDGRKTQTRRIVTLQPPKDYVYNQEHNGEHFWYEHDYDSDNGGHFPSYDKGIKPIAQIGDILYVKETWSLTRGFFEGDEKVLYKADFTDEDAKAFHWKPSLFMPKAYTRIFLKVTNVRVERLQDISEEDAIAEGVEILSTSKSCTMWKNYETPKEFFMSPIGSYMSLWNSINKKETEKQWDTNPYVFVYEFERVEKPEVMA